MRLLPKRFAAKLDSLLWRSLNSYGRIKYRYLLPVYRAFGMMKTAQPSDAHSGTLQRAGALSRMLNPVEADYYTRQLSGVIERVKSSEGAVIFLPSIGWEIPLAQRPHHLAREFARRGHVVIFDSSSSFDDVNGFREVEPNLFLYRGPEEVLPRVPDPLLWVFTHNYESRRRYPASARTVYDWIDDFEVFPYDRAFLESNHAAALKEATLVASVARTLHESALTERPDALYLPNAVEYQRFADDLAAPPADPDIEALRREGKPVAGYYGALAEWFDYGLLDEVAGMRPDWNFLLIGPVYDLGLRTRGQGMLKRHNIRWIGQRDYDTLPGYLSLFDVAIIPFAINSITLATSPLKLYEFFAAGKPVVTTRMPECEAFPEVRAVAGARAFSEALDQALAEGRDPLAKERLRRLGRENSWAARVETVLQRFKDRKGD
ncbi:MAG TPA: glycosyltransferase [Blastocatellia bacterium]|jgi:glycosyltransferase involved in cell wall biosynthesis|nr:glycosyltransferase [Blastocatellia bacterium]